MAVAIVGDPYDWMVNRMAESICGRHVPRAVLMRGLREKYPTPEEMLADINRLLEEAQRIFALLPEGSVISYEPALLEHEYHMQKNMT